ncbi:hypothetical protein N7G274_005401 [Stereocaulon virgatum]|uniref:Mif2/CENP-C cupin domain-containing protein n=1 Tax=Stereocaulon virgatum TaxID=373712 RepID=A0ABR4A6T8_9LECA
MGPRGRTPRKERGPGDYTAVGRRGRRTGTELADTGVRDENGLEPIPSFSSPAKSLHQYNGVAPETTYSADDSMDIDQSTFPGPAALVRSARNSLPPRGTSPRKTHLMTSPRRSVQRSKGPMSSPSRNLNTGTPTRLGSHPPMHMSVNRQLDFSLDKPRKSIEFSPQKPRVPVRPSRLTSFTSKGKNKRPFDLSIGADAYEDENLDALNTASTTNGMIYDDDDIIMELPDEGSALELERSIGNNGEHQLQNYESEESVIIQPQAAAGAKAIKKKPGKPAAAASMDDSQLSLAVPGSARARGRPPKKSKTEIYQDLDAGQSKAPSKPIDSKRMPPPKIRDPNIKTNGTKKNGEKAPSIGSASVGPKSSFFRRSETPATDSGALITRSGRQSIKPLQTWLGEKVVMGDRTSDSLPAIKEVVRVQEVIKPPRRRQQSAYRRTKRRARSRLEDVEEEGDEDDKAEWELDPGIMVAEVMDWDPNTNKYDEEMTRAEDIAYSYEAIEMREIAGADFKFAKTLTLDFFGAGMVDLPPGVSKRIKNSRKMQMVFFVFYGRVTVNVGTPPTRFSIGRGGQFQVPRGNFYSISNESDINSARIFFAQGCELQAGAADESTIT